MRNLEKNFIVRPQSGGQESLKVVPGTNHPGNELRRSFLPVAHRFLNEDLKALAHPAGQDKLAHAGA